MKHPAFFVFGAFAAVVSNAPAMPAHAHGGGLNAEGCHKNRKTGDYHCHRDGSSGASQSKSSKVMSAYSGGAFANCTAARAAGAAPIKRGDPGYGSRLDRDDDGVGCE
jgi:hypothetical protein